MDGNSRDALSVQVQALLADALRISEDMVTPDLALGEIPEWDSLGHMEVMLRLEEQFGVEINTDTIAELVSIPAICAYMESQTHA